jgi:hypothetical protein
MYDTLNCKMASRVDIQTDLVTHGRAKDETGHSPVRSPRAGLAIVITLVTIILVYGAVAIHRFIA